MYHTHNNVLINSGLNRKTLILLKDSYHLLMVYVFSVIVQCIAHVFDDADINKRNALPVIQAWQYNYVQYIMLGNDQ